MLYSFYFGILGGSIVYLWLQVRLLKAQNKANLNRITGIDEKIKLPEELKGYEIRKVIATNQVRIERLETELPFVKGLALRALDYMGSFIRHNKQHPPTPKAIKEFINEHGSSNESSAKK